MTPLNESSFLEAQLVAGRFSGSGQVGRNRIVDRVARKIWRELLPDIECHLLGSAVKEGPEEKTKVRWGRTAAAKREARELRRQGWTIEAIRDELGVAQSWLCQILSEVNQGLRLTDRIGRTYPARMPAKDELSARRAKVFELRKMGLTQAKIARELGVSPACVERDIAISPQ